MNPPHPDQRSKTELLALKVLCQDSPGRKAGKLQILKTCQWREPVHDAVFRCISQIPNENLRDALPGCLTRKGFPDFDFDSLFVAHTLTQEEAEKVIGDLVRS